MRFARLVSRKVPTVGVQDVGARAHPHDAAVVVEHRPG